MCSFPCLAVCNNVLTGLSGAISSPNFPDPYPHNRECAWTIAAPLGNAVNIREAIQ